jgi:hypothetical protein
MFPMRATANTYASFLAVVAAGGELQTALAESPIGANIELLALNLRNA